MGYFLCPNMSQITKPKVTIIPPKARQKALTTKLDKAIKIYARNKGVHQGYVETDTLITAAVSAYRMDSEKLFEWLETNRYRWDSSRQEWRDLRREL
jgi:hypothetical protein